MTVTNYQSYPQFPAASSDGGGSGPGLVLIASGSVPEQVEYFDVSLPTGYLSPLLLKLDGILLWGGDPLCVAFSFDDGATFIADLGNSDTYSRLSVELTSGAGGQLSGHFANDSIAAITSLMQSGGLLKGKLEIHLSPGNNVELTQITYSSTGTYLGTNHYETGWATLNPSATDAPTPARATTIRFFPYGNGDASPPTSGETITIDSWSLMGVLAS